MADSTDVSTDEGGLYLARREDLATRHMVGGAADARRTPDLVLTALDRAVARIAPRRGSYTIQTGAARTPPPPTRPGWRYGLTASMSRQGPWGDHACIESWHRLLKRDGVSLSHCRTRAAARTALFASIEGFYHRRRLPSAVGYRTPQEAVVAERTAQAMHSPFAAVHDLDISPR